MRPEKILTLATLIPIAGFAQFVTRSGCSSGVTVGIDRAVITH
jgi:hypothetical protein